MKRYFTRNIIGITALLLLLGSGSALADVINVPGDYSQIHDAVQAAGPGDTVLVAAGTYTDCTHETEGPGSTTACVIMRPGVTLRGAGPLSTIIDAQGLGRGIFVEDTDDVVIENLQVRGAYAEIYGAGILVRQNSTGLVIKDVRIEANGDGGVVLIQNTEGHLENVEFVGNAAKQGGGLAVEESSTATLVGCLIDNNTAPSGAGVFIRSQCTVAMTGCVITNNTIDADFGNGGGVCVQDAVCDISGSTISGNTTRGSGGGLAYISGASGLVTSCDIIGNSTEASYNFGGGITCQQSSPTLSYLLIQGNTAGGVGSDGGGIDIQFSPSPTITNCTLVGNQTSVADGGAGILVQWFAAPDISNCLITDSIGGKGVACVSADDTSIYGCNLWNNEDGDDICGIDGGCNFSADPLYCNAGENNFRIESGSPCVAGNHPDGGGCGESLVGAYPGGCGNAVTDLPGPVTVLGNAPNPFNPQTTIFFELDVAGDAVVRIHDLRGRTLRTFRYTNLPAGQRQEISWNGRDQDGRSLPSGVYLYQLESHGFSTSKRMSLIR